MRGYDDRGFFDGFGEGLAALSVAGTLLYFGWQFATARGVIAQGIAQNFSAASADKQFLSIKNGTVDLQCVDPATGLTVIKTPQTFEEFEDIRNNQKCSPRVLRIS